MKNNILLILLLLFASYTSFGRTIFSKYQTTDQYAEFDQVINKARFPTFDIEKNTENIEKLEAVIDKFKDYPELSAAYFFLGRCHQKLKNYRAALRSYKRAEQLNPNLYKKIRLKNDISWLETQVRRENYLILAFSLFISWSLLVFALFIRRIKMNKLTIKQLFLASIIVSLSVVFIILWFSYRSAPLAGNFGELYPSPVFVRSRIFEPGSRPLIILTICALFTSAITVISSLASVVFTRFKVLFPLLTALIVGASLTLLYYQMYCLKADRTGGGIMKSLTFPNPPIDFHKDIPDEMEFLYDEKVLKLIHEAKSQAELKDEE